MPPPQTLLPTPTPYRRACTACTTSKRRCTKDLPTCSRCLQRSLPCIYPPTRQAQDQDNHPSPGPTSSNNTAHSSTTDLDFAAADPTQDAAFLTLDMDMTPPNVEEDLLFDIDFPIMPMIDDNDNDNDDISPAPPPPPPPPQTQPQPLHTHTHPHALSSLPIPTNPTPTSPPWFTHLPTLTTAHPSPAQPPEWITPTSLHAYISTLQSWLAQWTAQNTCPVIHHALYTLHMPDCIQDAFTTLAAYQARTAAVERTLLGIVERRVDALVRGYDAGGGDGGGEADRDRDGEGVARDSDSGLGVVGHLARVQALLVYSVICLFDGDVRLRARGEAHFGTLAAWNKVMWERAGAHVTMNGAGDAGAVVPLGLGPPVESKWHMWLFLESVRRTWLTTSVLQAVYGTIRDGVSSCPGGVVCTFGKGVWEAESGLEWERIVEEKGQEKLLFVQSLGMGSVVGNVGAELVDDFGRAMMVVSYGLERTERWAAGKG